MKNNFAEQKNNFFIIALAATLLAAAIIAANVFLFKAETGGEIMEISDVTYENAVKNIDSLLKQYNADLFANPLFAGLKSVFKLPLEAGSVGKGNPFLLPIPPEDALLLRLSR